MTLRHRIVLFLFLPLQIQIGFPQSAFGQQQLPTNPKDAFVQEWVAPAPVLSTAVQNITTSAEPARRAFAAISLRANPTPAELHQSRAFAVAISVAPEKNLDQTESNDAGRLAEAYAVAGGRRTYANHARFDAYLSRHPDSPLRASLRAEQAHLYRQHGHLLKMEGSLRDAWEASRNRTDREGFALADRVLVELLGTLSRMGNKGALRELLGSVANRPVGGLAREAIWRAKEALAFLDQRAEQNIFCGFSAANLICVPAGKAPIFPDVHDASEQEQFVRDGLSLYELRAHSVEAGGDLAPFKRTTGDAIPVPSVVHWKFEHYSAITEERNGLTISRMSTSGSIAGCRRR